MFVSGSCCLKFSLCTFEFVRGFRVNLVITKLLRFYKPVILATKSYQLLMSPLFSNPTTAQDDDVVGAFDG